jgi:hypothetical protein
VSGELPNLERTCRTFVLSLSLADILQATASITIACDIITFLIPIPLFIRLQMDTRHKVNLIILFAAGNFTVACSIIRMLQIKQVQKDGNNSMLLLWGSVEMNIGVSGSFRQPVQLFQP